MGFYFRLAPGVKVRLTSRGVRTSIGPRAARLHVGAGGAGVSTGAGPFTFYSGLPRTHGTARSAAYRPDAVAATSTGAGIDKAAQAQILTDQFQHIRALNDVTFPARTRPLAPPPTPVDLAAITRDRRSEARRTTSVFNRSARRAALREADALAAADAEESFAEATEEMYRHQEQLDKWWALMETCEPTTVLAALAQSFEDNESFSAAVGVTGAEVSVVVVAPPMTSVPERKPTTTQAGNLSLKKLTKSETWATYKEVLAGHILLTVREAFAVVPSLSRCRILVVRRNPAHGTSDRPLEAILAARFERSSLENVSWTRANAVHIMEQRSEELLLKEKGVARELQPLDLSREPELASALGAVDAAALTAHD